MAVQSLIKLGLLGLENYMPFHRRDLSIVSLKLHKERAYQAQPKMLANQKF